MATRGASVVGAVIVQGAPITHPSCTVGLDRFIFAVPGQGRFKFLGARGRGPFGNQKCYAKDERSRSTKLCITTSARACSDVDASTCASSSLATAATTVEVRVSSMRLDGGSRGKAAQRGRSGCNLSQARPNCGHNPTTASHIYTHMNTHQQKQIISSSMHALPQSQVK